MGKILFAAFVIIAIKSLYAAELNCNYTSGACNVVSITNVKSENEEITIAGKPTNFQDDKTYSLSFQPTSILNYVPTGLFKYFTMLQSFAMFNNSLTTVVPNAFKNCGYLISITITQNNFPLLPDSFASTCVNITSLHLMQNYIKSIHTDAFKGLQFLNHLMLRDNEITCIPPDTFRHTTVLQHVDLYGNKITKLDSATFRGLPALASVMLGSNKIASIPNFDLKHTAMTMGFSLMFENNPILSIHPQFLSTVFSRPGYMATASINLNDNYGNNTSCIPRNNMYTSLISNYGWPMANVTLRVCYDNWNSNLENQPVSCAPISSTPSTTPITSTTPGTLTTTQAGKNNSKDFFAIITNVIRNFKAKVEFE